MTNKELELRLSNIEKAIADLAKKQSDRDNANTSSISDTNVNVEVLNGKNTEITEQVVTQGAVIDELLTDILPSLMGE